MKINVYSREEFHLRRETRRSKERKHKSSRDGLKVNGQTYSVGAESGGIPVLDDDNSSGDGPKPATIVGIGATPPTASEDHEGDFFIQYEAGKGSILKVCLNDGTDAYSWEPIIGKTAGGP